jgi:hypothetical protein
MASSSGRASTITSLWIRSSRTGSRFGLFITPLNVPHDRHRWRTGRPSCAGARPRDQDSQQGHHYAREYGRTHNSTLKISSTRPDAGGPVYQA